LLDVLAQLVAELDLSLVCASVDHGLRPDAANDVDAARRLAAGLGIPFHGLRVHVAPSASLQAAARAARYQALWECAQDVGAQRIAVGHTRDDQAETVLARLIRGTGVEGLSAIAPRRADGVIRPLIDCSRADVHAYARERALGFVRDPSNDDPRYLRTVIRKEVLPVLERLNPRVAVALSSLADDARELSRHLDQDSARREARGQELGECLSAEESPVLRRWMLRRWAKSTLGIVLLRTHLDALERMLERGGRVRLPGDWVMFRGATGALTVEPVTKRGRGGRRHSSGDEA
jgi:tRNA(Ile)-lysidine synthase